MSIDQSTALALSNPAQSVDIYRTMCAAIAECARVDEVREIRNRAKALEEYTRQAKNFEAEAQLSAIRLRAERRAGELLIEMAENGERHDGRGGNMRARSLNGSVLSLAELKVTDQRSSEWQQLARIPESDFETALAKPGVKRTRNVIAAHRPKQRPPTKNSAKQKELGKEGDYHRRPVCEAVLKVADGNVHSLRQMSEIAGRDAEGLLQRARMLPWLTIERMPEGYRLTVDEELRSICEDHAPRPQLSGAGVHAFIKRLAKEIDRKRKENHEKRQTIKWNPDNVVKLEQKRLLDWIEAELSTLNQLMTSSGPDIMSAIRALKHPSGDEKEEYVFQEKYTH